jgi:hypothetical protein
MIARGRLFGGGFEEPRRIAGCRFSGVTWRIQGTAEGNGERLSNKEVRQ